MKRSLNKPLAAIVCGYERGGTTLISQILRQHPKLDTGFECGFLLADKIPDFLSIETYYTMTKLGWKLEDEELKYICEADTWINVYKRLVEKTKAIEEKDKEDIWIFDKTPKYMSVLSDVLKKVPNVPCIVIVRDPRAVLWSWAKRADLEKDKWIQNQLKNACNRYLSYARGWEKAMKNGFESQILLVRYEVLCQDRKAEVEKIFKFLELDFDDSYLSFQEKQYYGVHGNKISNKYLTEYKENFSEETCEKILEITKPFREWAWEKEKEI